MMLCITRVKPVPCMLKPMAMSLTGERLIGLRASSHAVPSLGVRRVAKNNPTRLAKNKRAWSAVCACDS